MRYRLALFDFDGTLADSYSLFLSFMDRLADEKQLRRFEQHEIEALRCKSAREIIQEVGLPMWKLPGIGRQMRQHVAKNIDSVSLFSGVEEVLQGLARRGVRLGVITSNSEANVRKILGPGNAALIQHYGCGTSLFGKGPKLRAALRESGVAAAEAVCIGDEVRDLEAAREEGIAFWAVSWGYTHPDTLRGHGPEEMLESTEEILEKLG